IEASEDLARKAEVEDVQGAVIEEIRADNAYTDASFETLVQLARQIDLSSIDRNRLERARSVAEEAGLPLSIIPDMQYR
ncbi:MAG: hypothetical protein GWN37_14450, partial [Gammaproteobacteria bacterium]|nr:hypothetical protein [Gammaproteobacteria bacterium]